MTTDPFPISILAAGDGWLVVEKPAGLSIEERREQDLCTLLRSWIRLDPDLRKHIGCDPRFGVHPVHRLDRETSGVVLLSCRRETFDYFARQFERHEARKRYVALLHGVLPEPGGAGGWHRWSWPLSREAGGRLRPEGPGDAVPCETRFRVLGRSAHYTLVECDPLTGRKHQIRRHARLSGHAVVGDGRYGTPRSLRFLREKKGFTRLALHSLSLQIRTPPQEKERVFRSPVIPQEILRLLEQDQPTSAE